MAMLIENDLILASSVQLFNAELTQIASEIIKLSRAERWQEIADIMERHETKWMKGLKVRFTDQEAEVNRNIDIYLVPLYPDNLKSVHWTVSHKAVDDLLFDKEKWDIIFGEFGQLLLPGIVDDAGQRGLASLGLDLTFNIRNPRVTEFIDNKKFKFAQEVNQTTLENLRQQLREGVFNGEGIPELRRRVKDVFDEARTWRTAMIARTETGGAYNFGAFESYRQSRVVQMKEWLATHDMRTRDSHRSLDGERQPLESKFSNGLMYPGDPNGDASELINCRCTIIGIPVEQIIGGGEAEPEIVYNREERIKDLKFVKNRKINMSHDVVSGGREWKEYQFQNTQIFIEKGLDKEYANRIADALASIPQDHQMRHYRPRPDGTRPPSKQCKVFCFENNSQSSKWEAGRYDLKNGELKIFSTWDKYIEETTIHEFGHNAASNYASFGDKPDEFWLPNGFIDALRKDGKDVTNYGALKRPEEAFAEAYTKFYVKGDVTSTNGDELLSLTNWFNNAPNFGQGNPSGRTEWMPGQ